MPRKARIDAPGAPHHIICRGIERREIFRDDIDRNDFVETVLKQADETVERRYRLKAIGYDFDKLVDQVADFFELKPAEISLPSKQRHRVKARGLLCFWAVNELGMSSINVADRLGIN